MRSPCPALKKKLLFWRLQSLFFIFLHLSSSFFLVSVFFYWLCLLALYAGGDRNVSAHIFRFSGLFFWFFAARGKIGEAVRSLSLSGTAYEAVKIRPELAHYLPPAADFLEGKKRGSEELAVRHLEDSLEKARQVPLFLFSRKYFSGSGLKLLLAAALAASLPSGKNFTFADFAVPRGNARLEDFFSINPGNLEMIEEQDFELYVCPVKPFGGEPALRLGTALKKMSKNGPCFEYGEKKVSGDFEYRLSAGGLKSERYSVKVFREPGFASVRTRVFPPRYLGKNPEDYDFIPESLEVPEGAKVSFEFFSPREVGSLSAEIKRGENSPPLRKALGVSTGGGYFLEYLPPGDAVVSFYIGSKNGYSGLFSRSEIKVSPDAPPTCAILDYSPEARMLPGSFFALDYRLEDDTGLKEVYLVREKPSALSAGSKDEELIGSLPDFPREISARRLLPARWLKGSPYFEISVKGVDIKGQTCVSQKIKFYPDGSLSAHRGKMAAMAAYLAETEALERSVSGELPFPDVRGAFASLREKGAGIKSGLSADPFFEEWSRENVESALNRIERAGNEKLPAFLENGANKAGLLGDLSASAAELRLSLELEAASELGIFPGNMENSLLKIEELLAREKVSKADLRELDAEIGALMRELSELNAILSAAEASRRQAGGEKVFQVPAGEIAGRAAALKEALKRGDLKTAREYLKKLAESVKKVSNIIAEYKKHAYENSGMGAKMEAASKISAKWGEIYEAEKKEFAANSGFGDEFLPEFEARRSAFAADALGRLIEIKKSSPTAAELRELEKVVAAFQKGEYAALSSSSPAGGLPEPAAALVSSFSETGNFLAAGEKEFFSRAAGGQNAIKAEAVSLKKDLELNLFFQEPLEKLGKALGEMDLAERKLASFDLEGGLASQLKAVNHLEQGRKDFMEKMEEFLKSFQNGASSSEGTAGHAGEGRSGVKLPGREEYSPPELIRKEVIKSLGEKAPSENREKLEKYYKNITK